MGTKLSSIMTAILLMLSSFNSNGIEKLSAEDLRSLCQNMSSGDKYYASDLECQRYIKGFVDGLIIADKYNNSLQIHRQEQPSDFDSRAVSTRVQNRLNYAPRQRPSQLCFDDVNDLQKIVNTIAQHVVDNSGSNDTSYAKYLVYESLLTHFRCDQ